VGTLSNNTATVTIIAASTAAVFRKPEANRLLLGWRIAFIAAVCLLMIASMRRQGNWRVLRSTSTNSSLIVPVVMLACLLTLTLSCGGGGGGSGQVTSSPESGTVTVQGTGRTSFHTASISVTVN
jgi:hypothetical protein